MSQKSIRLPAEWEPQSAVQIVWPESHTDWVEILPEAERCYQQIAFEISKRQILIVCCQKPDYVKSKLAACNQKNLRLVKLATNDTWARDFGGITITENGQSCVLDFTFNGWGMKFPANHDNQITRNLFNQNVFAEGVRVINKKQIVLERGSIESDGSGTLMTTETCLREPNRNPWADKQTIEKILKETFGLHRVLWIKNGFLTGDDTDSHIDTLARFCSQGTIAYVGCENENDEHYDELRALELELKSFRQINNEPYKLLKLPMAEPIFYNGEKVPATYANFLIINGAVLVPTYGTQKDQIALDLLSTAFTDREIIGIDSRALIKQHGSLHCITMEYPMGVVN